MLVAAALFALMGVFVKFGAAHFSSTELVFYRTLIGLTSIGGLAVARGWVLRSAHWVRHMKRGVVGYFALLLYFYAIAHLPLGTAVTLNYTSPMFLAALSAILLHESLSKRVWWSLALGFVGVAVLLKPTLGADQWFAGLVGLLSGAMAGWAYLHVRELSRLGEPEWRVVFYFSLVSCVGGIIWMGYESQFGVIHSVRWDNLWILLGLGGTATLAQLALTRAYAQGQKFVVASLAYSTVVFSTVLGAVLWGDSLPLSSYLAIGLIMVSGVFASRR